MPMLPVDEAAAQVIAARVGYVDTPELTGIAYVTGFRQDLFPFTRDDLQYTFQGLSNDGRWYVAVNWNLRATMLPRRFSNSAGAAHRPERSHLGALHPADRGHARRCPGVGLPPVPRLARRHGPFHRLRERGATECIALGVAVAQRRAIAGRCARIRRPYPVRGGRFTCCIRAGPLDSAVGVALVARLIYSMLASLDGYVADEQGDFSWATPDEEVHAFINDLERGVGTMLVGRRMYEVLSAWEDHGPRG